MMSVLFGLCLFLQLSSVSVTVIDCNGLDAQCNQNAVRCVAESNTDADCFINCLPNQNGNNGSSAISASSWNMCAYEQGGCCNSAIYCPTGRECHINCFQSCQNLVVYAQNSTALAISNCSTQSCVAMDIHCPSDQSRQCDIHWISTILDQSAEHDTRAPFWSNLPLLIGLCSAAFTFLLCSCFMCIMPYWCCKLCAIGSPKSGAAAPASYMECDQHAVPPFAVRVDSNDSQDTCMSSDTEEAADGHMQVTGGSGLIIDRPPQSVTITRVSSATSSKQQRRYDYYMECISNAYDTSQCEAVSRIIAVMVKFELLFQCKQGHKIDELLEKRSFHSLVKNDYDHVLMHHDDDGAFAYIYDAICAQTKEITGVMNGCDVDHEMNGSLFDCVHGYFMHSYALGLRHAQQQQHAQNEESIIAEPEHSCRYSDVDTDDVDDEKILALVCDTGRHGGHDRDASFVTVWSQTMLHRHNRFRTEVATEEHEKRISRSTMHSYSQAVHSTLAVQPSLSHMEELTAVTAPEEVMLSVSVFNDDDVKPTHVLELEDVYSFGIRWYYWPNYRDDIHFVAPKYDTLKHELLHNQDQVFTLSDWTDVHEKAASNLQSFNGRSLTMNSSPLIDDYGGVERGGAMSRAQMMALVIYCNFDTLQFEMKRTFRSVRKGETLDSIKQRNRVYAHWSRLLREAIELFGTLMRDTPHIRFYHGIVGELVFPTTMATFCPPTSFTTSVSVASTFSGGTQGVILELGAYGMDVAYFDCRWISDYSNEQERVVCGGYQCFIVRNIMLMRLEHNYAHYVQAINVILCLIDIRKKKKPLKKISSKTVKTISALIKASIKAQGANASQIPDYVLKLFDCIRMNCCQSIQLSLDHFHAGADFNSLNSVFVDNCGTEREWLRLDVLSKLFILCPIMTVYNVRLSSYTLQKLFTFCQNVINKSRFIQLNQIIFKQPNESLMSVNSAANKWQAKFEEIEFMLIVDSTENTMRLTKTT